MIGWLDCSSGASGDMLLGALVGAGVPLDVIDEAVQAVVPEPVTLSVHEVTRAGLAATQVQVATAESRTARSLGDVRTLLHGGALDSRVAEHADAVFARLAEAEARAHGIQVDDVHFHEVGALDAIADVVGSCAGLVRLGMDTLSCSAISVGGGTVRAAHGLLPVPPPAVVELLRGWVSVGGPADQELCTPTGAALVTSWAQEQGAQPAMRVERVGVGAGGRDLPGRPNVLRLLVGAAASAERTAEQVVLEANVDDLDPRLWPQVLSRLLAAGAADAWLTPILMKKGRPAHTLSVLADAGRRAEVLAVVFAESTTIGMRAHPVDKVALERSEAAVLVDGHRVRVKLALLDGRVVNAQPEYADVAAASAALGRPLKVVLARAVSAAEHLW